MNTRTYDSNRPQEISCGLTYKKGTPQRWGERRYYALDYYLKQNFGEKLYKISLNGGCSCPNRDGTCGTRGCIFCSEGGSGDFAASSSLSVADQLAYGKGLVRPKYNGHSYIAYFQAYTNTYGELEALKRKYEEALSVPDVVCLVIGTRPDCMPDTLLHYLEEVNKNTFLLVEYGIESTHDATLRRINRGHTFQDTVDAVERTVACGILTGGHVILGLPGETHEDLVAQAATLSRLPITTLKMHQLQLIRGTRMAHEYEQHPEDFHLFGVEEYIDLVIDYIEHLRPDLVLERFVSQSPKELLIAPDWGLKNYEFNHRIQKKMRQLGAYQGKKYDM